jgi:hypothetical protein
MSKATDHHTAPPRQRGFSLRPTALPHHPTTATGLGPCSGAMQRGHAAGPPAPGQAHHRPAVHLAGFVAGDRTCVQSCGRMAPAMVAPMAAVDDPGSPPRSKDAIASPIPHRWR